MKRKRIIYGLLALLLAGLAGYGLLPRRVPPPKRNVAMDVFGSRQTLNAFLSASEVMAERLHLRSLFEKHTVIEGYDRGAAVLLSADQGHTLRQLLTQESSDGWRFQKMCSPDYGVLLTARSGESNVRIALCFRCNILGVYDSEDDTANAVNRERDFVEPASTALTRLAKQLFPNDSDIRKLE